MVREPFSESGNRLLQARRYATAAIAEEERLHQRYLEHQALAERWQERAALALKKDLEPLAQQALERRRLCQALAEAYKVEYEEQRRLVAGLKRELPLIEAGGRSGHPISRALPLELEAPQAQPRYIRSAMTAVRTVLEIEADPVADRLAELEREELLERQLAELKAKLALDAQSKL